LRMFWPIQTPDWRNRVDYWRHSSDAPMVSAGSERSMVVQDPAFRRMPILSLSARKLLSSRTSKGPL
jgi:hypothetical protein